MTFLEQIQAAIRAYIINLAAQQVVSDIATNGLTPADEAIIQAYLNQTAP